MARIFIEIEIPESMAKQLLQKGRPTGRVRMQTDAPAAAKRSDDPRGKRLTDSDRKKIEKHLKEGKLSVAEIARDAGVSEPTVYIIKTRLKREGVVLPYRPGKEHPWRGGRRPAESRTVDLPEDDDDTPAPDDDEEEERW